MEANGEGGTIVCLCIVSALFTIKLPFCRFTVMCYLVSIY